MWWSYVHWASKETYNFLERCLLKSTALYCIGYMWLGYSSSIAKNYTIFLVESKLGCREMSPKFWLISGIRGKDEFLDCEHGENHTKNLNSNVNPFIRKVSLKKCSHCVCAILQFLICDLVFANWMWSVMREFQGHNLQSFL